MLATKLSQEIHEIFVKTRNCYVCKKNCLLWEKFNSMLSSHFMTASIRIVKRQQKSTIKKAKIDSGFYNSAQCLVINTSKNLLVVATTVIISACHHEFMILRICTVVSLNSYSQVKLLRAGRNSTWVIFRQTCPKKFSSTPPFPFRCCCWAATDALAEPSFSSCTRKNGLKSNSISSYGNFFTTTLVSKV